MLASIAVPVAPTLLDTVTHPVVFWMVLSVVFLLAGLGNMYINAVTPDGFTAELSGTETHEWTIIPTEEGWLHVESSEVFVIARCDDEDGPVTAASSWQEGLQATDVFLPAGSLWTISGEKVAWHFTPVDPDVETLLSISRFGALGRETFSQNAFLGLSALSGALWLWAALTHVFPHLRL